MPSDGTRTRFLWLCRFGVGCAMGTVFPALHSVLARAVPLEARNRAVSFMTSGMYFGSAFAMVFVPCVMGLGGAHLAFTSVGFHGTDVVAVLRQIYQTSRVYASGH